MTPVERLLAKLPGAKRIRNGWSARCPAHDDETPSLSIGEGDDGRVLLTCHAGCEFEDICAALDLTASDLAPAKATSERAPRIVAKYDYRDEEGNIVLQVVRIEPKGFRQRRPDGKGGWTWSVRGVPVVPYRLQELLAQPTSPVVIAEGEKDCDNLAGLGLLATCNAGGAGKWTTEHSEFLRGRRVVVLPDNDEAGRNHAQQVAQLLYGVADWVKIVELPGLPEKGDVSDWIAAGGTKENLIRIAKATPVWTPPTGQPWPEIISFDVLELPDFPTHALPGVLRQWVEAESHATQTPADLAGLLAIAVCSAGIARRVVVEPRSDWSEPVNLFVSVLLEPGNRKSAVFADATRPLRDLEAELIEAAREEIARAQSDRRQNEARLKKLEDFASEKHGDEADRARCEAGDLAEKLAKEVVPVLPRLIVDDATSEKLGIIMAEQGGRIASMSPEGGVFDLVAGLYSKNGLPQFAVYLKGHTGDDLNTDRVGRRSVRVERPALTCAYAIQPSVIDRLATYPAFRDRGFLARFLYAIPRSWIGHREIAPPPVPEEIREAYRAAVRRLAVTDGDVVLRLSPEAASLFSKWQGEIEEMLRDGGPMEGIRDWGGKLAGATVRLAAVIHCVDNGLAGCIESQTVSASIRIARFLIPHAEAVLKRMLASGDSHDGDARYVLRWIERHARREFTKSEAQHHGKRRFRKADDIAPALSELTRRGYIRLKQIETSGPGRPASPSYEVNPAFIGDKNSG